MIARVSSDLVLPLPERFSPRELEIYLAMAKRDVASTKDCDHSQLPVAEGIADRIAEVGAGNGVGRVRVGGAPNAWRHSRLS
jgi:hypothetical protein